MPDLSDKPDGATAPVWQPVTGDVLAGEIVALTGCEHDDGPFPIITIRTADGEEVAVHARHMPGLCPRVGQRVRIDYLGDGAPDVDPARNASAERAGGV